MIPATDPSYTAQALRTESPITPALQTRLQQQARLVHAVLGLQTEAGELADPVKKHIYYGRPLDPVNLREEIGDCLWYLAIACDALGTTLEAEQTRNLAKLRARYPHVFTAEAAQVRDLDRERQVLEGAEVATLRQQLAAAQRAASDEFTERQVLTVEQQQDAAAWQQQVDSANSARSACLAAEVGYLRKRLDEERSVSARLREKLDATRAETVETRRRLNEETDRHNRTNAEKVELFQKLQWANQNNAELVRERDAARATVDLQRAAVERQSACIGKVRRAQNNYQWPASWNEITAALAELDGEPAPVAEPLDVEGGQ